MRRAIEVARAGGKRVFPNPLVGAVILDSSGNTVSEGYHACCGAPHAEQDALNRTGDVKGCTMVVTLEPCVHHGRTPPCVEAIVNAGIRRVVVGLVDPDPRVSGRGIEYLRSRGLEVETGPFEEEIRELNRTYLHHTATGRSFLHLKMAGTLDGRSAAADGTSRWITGGESRKRVHGFRKDAHAVLIGGKTAAADDPLLSVRAIDCSEEEQPVRIIYTDFELPAGLKLFNTPGRTVVATGSNISAPPSAELWTGICSPEDLLRKTAEEGLGLVLCEGGKTLAASLIVNGLVDRLSIFTAPALLGADGVPLLGTLNVKTIDGMLRLRNVEISRIGDDILTEGQIVHRAD